MNFRSYFPDSKGKYGCEMNNELCFFNDSCQSCISWKCTLKVLIQPKILRWHWNGVPKTSSISPMQNNQRCYEFHVWKSYYFIVSKKWPNLSSFLYSEFFRQLCNTNLSITSAQLCVLHRPQWFLLTMTQRWWPVHLDFSFTNPVNTIITLKRPSWEMQLSWSLFLSQGNKTVTIYFLPCTISMGSFPPPCASISLR